MADRATPRVTMNALAEYLTASAGRRRAIITEQRSPKTFRVAYYADAEDAIVATIADQLSETPLEAGRARILAAAVSKPWDMARRDTQLEAIEAARAFLQTAGADSLRNLALARRRTSPLLVGGVAVSVRPDLLVEATPGVVVGVVKLFFSKTAALNEERSRYAGAILQMAIEGVKGAHGVDYRRCLVLDVFARRLHQAPRTSRRRRQDVEAACSEIETMWSA